MSASTEQTILVIGGTGMLGEPVARRLLADGHRVRVLSRDAGAARAKLGEGFDMVEGDVEQGDSLARALDGSHGVHVNLMGGPRPKDFERVEHRGTAAVARAAAGAGVHRLTYLSGAPARPENFHDPASKAKYEAELAIRDSGVPYTIFRATWMMESLPLFIRGRRAILIGRHRHPVRWIAAGDFARMVSRSYELDDAANRTLLVVGPEAHTKRQALETYCSIVRPEARVRYLPIRFMSPIARLSRDPQLRMEVRRMAFYDQIGDDYGDPSEANALLGSPTTTLARWCEMQRDEIAAV